MLNFNYIILPRVAGLDYYLERISIKLANLFGVFYNVVLFLFIAVVFCSFILWLILPIIEFRKKALLRKIYEQLVENQEILHSIRQNLFNPASQKVKIFPRDEEEQ